MPHRILNSWYVSSIATLDALYIVFPHCCTSEQGLIHQKTGTLLLGKSTNFHVPHRLVQLIHSSFDRVFSESESHLGELCASFSVLCGLFYNRALFSLSSSGSRRKSGKSPSLSDNSGIGVIQCLVVSYYPGSAVFLLMSTFIPTCFAS